MVKDYVPFNMGTKLGFQFSSLLFNILIEVVANVKWVIITIIEIKDIHSGKYKISLSLLTDDINIYVKNPKEFTINHNEGGQHSFPQRGKYKAILYLEISNKESNNEIKNTIPFIKSSKIITCLGINLTKEDSHTLKTTKHWYEMLKRTYLSGETFHTFILKNQYFYDIKSL